MCDDAAMVRSRTLATTRTLAAALTLATSLVVAACAAPAVAPVTPAVPGATTTSAPGTSNGPSSPTLAPYSPGPSASPEDPATLYARIEAQVEQIRGLTAIAPVAPRILDQAQLAAQLRSRFDQENPPAIVAGEQALYQDLGLFPRDASLKDELLKLLTSQIAGFYRPQDKELYVISQSGSIGPSQLVTFAHEFDHALQDQHFDLTKLGIDTPDQGDRSLARLSLAEGDATLLMSQWAQQNLSPLQTLQLLQESADPAQTAILASMPPFLKDELLFPYTSGLTFIEGLWAKGGWPAVDAAYATPPDSTAQILHPEQYLAHQEPVPVTLAADIERRLGAGWSQTYADTLGEFGLREWLTIVGGLQPQAAADAATGWAGDRVAVLEGPGGSWGAVLVTRWTSATDAGAFHDAAATTVASALPAAVVAQPSSTTVTVLFASDVATLGRLRSLPTPGG